LQRSVSDAERLMYSELNASGESGFTLSLLPGRDLPSFTPGLIFPIQESEEITCRTASYQCFSHRAAFLVALFN